MRIKEDQHDPITGRFPKYYLPDLKKKTYLMGQILHLKSISASQTVEFPSFLTSQLVENLCTCQKNGGEK